MEPVLLTASGIASLIFSKALEKGSEQLGEAVFNKISELLNIIQKKFKTEGVEGKIVKSQEDPSDKNKSRFANELEIQMKDDEVFSKKLTSILSELKLDDQVNQIFLKDINVQGDAEIGEVKQITTRSGPVTQEAVTQIEVGGNLTIGHVTQES